MRALHAADAALLHQLHAQCFVAEEVWSVTSFADMLSSPQVFGWALGQEAFILGRVVADEAELLTLAVAPAARRQGQARRLLDALLAGAAARGATRMFLEVAETNDPARQLYTQAGFVQCGRRANYYANHVAALVLERYL